MPKRTEKTAPLVVTDQRSWRWLLFKLHCDRDIQALRSLEQLKVQKGCGPVGYEEAIALHAPLNAIDELPKRRIACDPMLSDVDKLPADCLEQLALIGVMSLLGRPQPKCAHSLYSALGVDLLRWRLERFATALDQYLFTPL